MRGSRLVGLVLILSLAVLLVSVKPAWADGSTSYVTPTEPTAGVPFTITNVQSDASHLTIYYGDGCSGTVLYMLSGFFAGNAIITIESTTPGLTIWPIPAGEYSSLVPVVGESSLSPCRNFIIIPAAPPIPEYPLGLPLLAIFMILAYGVIRRRTVAKQK